MSSPYILPEAEHLLADEVDFDLRLRKQVVDRRETLEDRQRFLRRLMKEERNTRVRCKGKHLFKDEIKTIKEMVKSISSDLSKKFDHGLISRLRHYLIRANSAIVETEEEAVKQIEVCRKIEEILRSFEQKIFMESEEGIKDPTIQEKDPKGSSSSRIDNTTDQDEADKKRKEEDRAIEKQKELEKEWKEFLLWKQEKLQRKTIVKSDKEKSDEERPPESFKSRKSRSRSRESRSSSGSRSPECSKNRKPLKEFEKVGNRSKSDRRPPESNKSRKSLRSVSREREDSCDRKRISKEKVRRRNRYSSESSAERPRKGKSRERTRKYAQSDSEEDRDASRSRKSGRSEVSRSDRHRKNRGRSQSSSESEYSQKQYRKSRVENWDLNFSGDSRSIQVEDFLNRIQKLARHEGVSRKELLMNIHRRLKGEAYDWWFTREEHLTSWKRFESEIRFRYGNPNRDRGIRAQIREFKQRKGETFIAYVTEVEKLNQCLEKPFSSRTLFELIWENMRPHYRSKLSVLDIDNLEDLIDINHKIDANDASFFRSNQGNRNELHHLEVENDNSSEDDVTVNMLKPNQRTSKPMTSSKPQQQLSEQQKPRITTDSFCRQPNPRRSSTVVCWNCRKTGHIFRECRGPRQLFCFVCGKLGKTARSCDGDHSVLNQQKQQQNAPTN